MRNAAVFLLWFFFLCIAGCNRAPSCEEVHAHMMTIFPEAMQKAAGSGDPALKQRSIEKCEKQTTPQARKCIMAASDMGGIMTCVQQHPAKQLITEEKGGVEKKTGR